VAGAELQIARHVIYSRAMVNPNPGRSIQLATYQGTGISNSIDVDAAPGLVALAKWKLHNKIQAAVAEVAPPTGRYNCYGMTFASRRTNVPAPGVDSTGLIDQILTEDQYVQIPPADVSEGDIVLWRLGPLVPHTGIVTHIERVGIRVIFVASKWGALGEYVHLPAISPSAYRADSERYNMS